MMKMMGVRHIKNILTKAFFFITFVCGAQPQALVDSFNINYQQDNFSKCLDFWGEIDVEDVNYEMVKNAGNCYYYLGAFSDALKMYYKADSILGESISSDGYELALNFGNVYRALGQTDKEIESLLDAKKIVSQDSTINPSRLFLSFGQYYEQVNKSDSAEAYFLMALISFNQHFGIDHKNTILMYSNIGDFYRNNQEYEKALVYFAKGLEATESTSNSISLNFIFNYNISLTYYDLRDWSKAIYFFNKSLSLLPPKNKSYKSYIESALAYCYSRTGVASSDSLFMIKGADGDQMDTLAFSYHLICYGKHLVGSKKNYLEAQAYYYRAYNLLQQKFGTYHSGMKDIYQILGTSALKLNVHDSALYYLQRSLYCSSAEVDTGDYASNPSVIHQADQWLFDLIDRKLRVLAKITQSSLPGDSAMGINHLILSNSQDYIQLLEHLLHNKTFLTDKKTVLHNNIRGRMLHAVNACYKLYRQTNNNYYFEKGLEFSEAGKYMLLKSMLDDQTIKAGLPPELVNYDHRLKNEINRLHHKKIRIKVNEQNEKGTSIDMFEKQLFELIVEKDSLRNVILSRYPESQRFESFKFSLGNIRRHIEQDQVVVEYYIQDSVLHAFYLSRQKLEWRQLENTGEVLSAVKRVREFSDLVDYGKVSKSEYLKDACTLNNILISIADSLVPGAREYVIIPDGELIFLPFDILLPANFDENMRYRDLPYLFRDHNLIYYHSLRFILNKKSSFSNGVINYLSIAPKFYGDTLQTMEQNPNALVDATYEAGDLNSFFEGIILTGDGATKEQFLSHAPGKRILHFATHASLNPEDAFDSHILLAIDTATELPEQLFASEICCLNLDAKLVVLSSCHSGSGQILPGEGVISLAWAFRYAGCESVVTSMFQLDDESARQIMSSFYSYLVEGKTKNTALQQARLDFLEKAVNAKTHPRFWAGLRVSGNQQAIIHQGGYKVEILILVIVILGSILMFVFGRKWSIKSVVKKRS